MFFFIAIAEKKSKRRGASKVTEVSNLGKIAVGKELVYYDFHHQY